MFPGLAAGEPASPNDGPAVERAGSKQEESVDEDAPFIDIDIDTNFEDEIPFIDIDVSRFPFPTRDPSRKKRAEEEEGEEKKEREKRWNDFLPLFREQAIERGFELPFPMGVGAGFVIIDQSLKVTDLRVGLGGSDPTTVGILNSGDVDANSKNANLRLDAWVLPVLNVYGIVGYTWVVSDVVLKAEIDPPSLAPTVVDIPVATRVEGWTYGLGGTLVGGYKQVFGMFDVNHTWTDIPAFDNKIKKIVATVRTGWQGDLGPFTGALWVGTMYLNNKQTIEVTLPPNTGVPALDGARIEIDQNSDHKFNFIFGGVWEVNRRYQLAVEGGVGERNHFIISAGYRF
jgi:hypothetical protein